MGQVVKKFYLSSDFIRFSIILISYFVTAEYGLRLDTISGFATLVWAPTGIALASLFICGSRFWPAIFVGACLVNIVVGAPPITAIGIGIGNTLEALVGTYLLRKVGFDSSISRMRDVVSLFIFGALLSTMVSATFGTISLLLGNLSFVDGIGFLNRIKLEGIPLTWQSWWLADALSDLIVAPVILVWITVLQKNPICKTKTSPRTSLEAFLFLALLLTAGFILFSPFSAQLSFPIPTLPYVLFPFVVWAPIRYQQQGSTFAVLLISVLAVWGTSRGYGPFSHAQLRESLFLVLGFISVLALTGLTLAASVSERKKANQGQRDAEECQKKTNLELEKYLAKVEYLSRFSEILATSLDYEATLSKIAVLIVPKWADWCMVNVLDESNNLKCLALTHKDPKKIAAALELQKLYPVDPKGPLGIAKVIRTGKSEFYPLVTDETIENYEKDPSGIKAIKDFGIKSTIVVPLTFQGQTLGTITFLLTDSGRYFNNEDLRFAEEIGRRASIAIENAMLYKQIERSVQIRDEFLSIASHELRTPLTSLYMQLQLIARMLKKSKEENPVEEKVAEKIALSEGQAKQLGNLIDILLDVSKLGTDGVVIEKNEINITSLAKEVVSGFYDQAKKAGVRLTFHGEREIKGRVDRVRVSQAITNLISNAIKYGSEKPVDVYVTSDKNMARIIVKDHGLGISEKDQSRVFERFERAISHYHISGMGLGLYITREIAKAHGGRILLESTVHEGSTFTLELPLRDSFVGKRRGLEVAHAPSTAIL